MKKQLLSIFAAMAVTVSVFAQTPSPSWSTSQNASFILPSPTSVAGTRYLDAIDANVMWVGGYDGTQAGRSYNWVSRTIDGGNTFSAHNVFSDTNTYVLSNMEGVDANTAWVCAYQHGGPGGYTSGNPGGGGIFKTTDGGVTWTNMTAQGMYTNTAQCFANWITFLTPLVGIANGDPVNGVFELWKTIDGGNTWTHVPSANIPAPQGGEFALTNVYCKQGTSNIWYGTNQGRIYRTFDAGQTWNVSSTGTSAGIINMAFITPSMGIVQANDQTAWNTTDGGLTWNPITNIDPNMGWNEIKAIPGTNYYVSVDNQTQIISYSNDNGITWTNWGSTGIPYLTIDFADASHGWAGSFSGTSSPSTGDIWKYTGSAMTPTNVVAATAAFTLATNVCGPTATLIPVNNSTGYDGIGLTYTWSSSPSSGVLFSSPSASAPSISFSGTGSYTISLTAGNLGGTNVTSQVVNIVTCSAPTASFVIPATSCNGVAFSATSTINQGTPTAGIVWSASPSNGVSFLPSAAVANPSIKFQNAGTYTVTLVASNVSGSVSASNVVTITDCSPTPNFSLFLGSSSSYTYSGFVCRKGNGYNDTLYTNNMTAGSGVTYSWTINPSTLVNITNYNSSANKKLIFSTTSNTNSTTYTITLKATNVSGSNQVSQVIRVQNCYVGISENSLTENMSVYPNPAHEQLTLSLPDAGNIYNIKLVNVLGSVVYENSVKNSATVNINIADKVKGIYFLMVESSGEKATKKIIVE